MINNFVRVRLRRRELGDPGNVWIQQHEPMAHTANATKEVLREMFTVLHICLYVTISYRDISKYLYTQAGHEENGSKKG